MRKQFANWNAWTIGAVAIIVVLFIPNISIVAGLFSPVSENWEHIREYMLASYIRSSLTLVIFTAILTILIGLSLAWLIAQYQFPLRNFMKWALILPLSIPPFIGAYTYHGILNYTGVIQTTLRNQFDVTVHPAYFDIMNVPGAVFIYTLFLYPYVYMITRVYLSNQSASLIESARTLGKGPIAIFWKVVIPISRASIVGGASLVILEVLNDYGVVKYFGIQTFSTAIFQTWFGLGDLYASIKLAGALMGMVLLILMLERALRGSKKYSYASTKLRPLPLIQLTGKKAFFATSYTIVIFTIAFLIPILQLIDWVVLTYGKVPMEEVLTYTRNSVMVGGIAAALIVLFALIVGNFSRIVKHKYAKILPKLTVLGYSIPGAVIAVAVVSTFIQLDRWLLPVYQAIGLDSALVLSVSLWMLISAYIIRFFAIGYNSIETGYEKIGTDFRDASRMLGANSIRTFLKIDLPMMKGAILSGFILAFVDIMKEIPLTLILRPFNYDTLATKAFQYASDEKIMEASQASILIVLLSAIAIFVFHKLLREESD